MKVVQLVTLDPAVNEALAGHPDYFKAMMAENWARVAELVHQEVGRILTADLVSVDQLGWGGYFVVDEETREVVGSCAFKGEPTGEGVVELAYFTYPGFEGKGYATLMAEKLIGMAVDSSEIKRVIAHTLPKKSASTRVLEKVAMNFAGEVNDPDDGRVWRWETDVD